MKLAIGAWRARIARRPSAVHLVKSRVALHRWRRSTGGIREQGFRGLSCLRAERAAGALPPFDFAPVSTWTFSEIAFL